MNTNARNLLSASGLGLLSFTVSSALISGASAVPTLAGFALLAAYGVIEIAVLSYATPHRYISRAETLEKPAIASASSASALVPFPVVSRPEYLARAA